MRPRVSVTMVVYQPDPVFFPEAVRSILSQTLGEFELLIVEDPSPSSGRDLLAGIRDARISYMRNCRRTSLVEQRRQAVVAARAPLVAILDADDIAEPDRLAKQVAYMDRYPTVDVLGSQIAVIDALGRIRGHRTFPTEHTDILRGLRRTVPICQPSVMFRREALLRWGTYRYDNYSVVEDYALWSVLARRGARFANHTEVLTRYRLHSSQLKATCLRSTIRGTVDIKRRYWAREMDIGDRLRLAGECCLLLLPSSLVLRLLHWRHYRDGPPTRNLLADGGAPGAPADRIRLAQVSIEAIPAPQASSGLVRCRTGSE